VPAVRAALGREKHLALYKVGKIYYTCFVTSSGQYVRRSTKLTKPRQAEQFETELRKQLDRTGGILTKVPTLMEFQKAFFQHAESCAASGVLDPKTVLYYRTGWAMLEGTSLASMRLTSISRAIVSSTQFGKSSSNRNCGVRTLRRMLGHASELGLLHRAPALKLAKEWGRQDLIEPWMEQRLLEVTSALRPRESKFAREATFQPLRDVFLIMFDCGLRNNEVFQLSWSDIAWERNSIIVRRGKTPKSWRVVPMTERVQLVLRDRIKVQRDHPKERVRVSEWVFPATGSQRGKSGHVTRVDHQFREAKLLAGIPERVKLYCSRHTFATDAMAATGNVFAVMRAMGHTNAATLNRYQHPAMNLVRTGIEERNKRNAARIQ
jgi:integrase